MSDLLNQASLVMVPSGYKEDTVYSVVPSDGSGDLSFTRASNGTRINSAGLVEVVPWNLLEYSEDFTNGVWVKTNTTTSADTTTAPNGTTTADSLLETATTGDHRLWERPSLIAGQVYSFTIYVKQNGRKRFQIKIFDSSSVQASALFDVATGTIVATNGTSSIESVGNGWYRCLISATSPTTSTGYCVLDLATDSYTQSTASESYAGDTSKGLYIWGAQLNIGSTAKPYFPTTDRLNVPRLTYQNGGGGCPSLLLEKQSTNYFPYSQDVSQWYEPDDGITLSQNTTDTTSPDGTNNAAKITIVGGNQRNYQITNSVAGTGTFSAYVKAGTSSTLALYTSSASLLIGYNLSTLAVTQTTGTGTITSVGNGWYRITATNTLGASEVLQVLYTGNANETIYIWGFQVEASSYATSYIPTTSSSATRVADYVSRSGLALTNSTFAVNFKPLDYVVELFDFEKTGGGRMFYIAVQSNGYITFNSVSGGTIGAIGSILPKNQTCKLAFTLNASTSNLTVFINGSKIGTYATNITTFGAFFGLQSFGYNPGTQIEQIAIFPSVLTDAECQSLTA